MTVIAVVRHLVGHPVARRGAVPFAIVLAWAAAGSAGAASGAMLDAERMQQAASEALVQWLATRCDRFEIAPVTTPESPVLPPGRIDVAARPVAASTIERRIVVWLDVRVDGRPWRSLPVAYAVRAWGPAWIATRDGHVGESVADVVPERRDVELAALGGVSPTAPAGRLKRPVRTGDVLLPSHVESAPAVARGEPVLVRARAGAVLLEARADALQDGREGSDVWVRIAGASGPIKARVVSPHTVEIDRE